MANQDNNACLFGFFLVAVIGVWLTLSMMSAWYLSLASLHWPTANGHVITSGVDSGTTTLGDWWAPSVKYKYQVGAKSFQSDMIRFYIPLLRDSAAAEAIRSPYPAGKLVSVYYDPDHPNRSVLEPGFRQAIWMPTLATLMYWSMAAFLYYEVTHPGSRLLPRLALAMRRLRRPNHKENDQEEAA